MDTNNNKQPDKILLPSYHVVSPLKDLLEQWYWDRVKAHMQQESQDLLVEVIQDAKLATVTAQHWTADYFKPSAQHLPLM